MKKLHPHLREHGHEAATGSRAARPQSRVSRRRLLKSAAAACAALGLPQVVPPRRWASKGPRRRTTAL